MKSARIGGTLVWIVLAQIILFFFSCEDLDKKPDHQKTASKNEKHKKINPVPEDEQPDTLDGMVHKPTSLVKEKEQPNEEPAEKEEGVRYIYLTFDDGPQHGTMTCYRICKELGVKASFFMVGQHADKHLRYIVDTIRESYPETVLVNHSYSHAHNHYKKFYSAPGAAQFDFYRAQDSLKVPYKILRLPGNSTWSVREKLSGPHNTLRTAHLLDSAGYDLIGWDVEWNFKGKESAPVQSAEQMVKLVDAYANSKYLKTKNHIVILTHDRMFAPQPASDSLYKFIEQLKKNPRYVFRTIDQYPGIKRNKT